jgi:hypothetical protein
MQKQFTRLAVLFILVVGLMGALAAPAGAATNQLSGVAVFDPGGVCPDPPAGFEDFTDLPPLVMTGSLEGCWYTKIVSAKDNGAPSGIYQERGEEVFVGSLDGGHVRHDLQVHLQVGSGRIHRVGGPWTLRAPDR